MTNEELDALQGLCEAATAGPWRDDRRADGVPAVHNGITRICDTFRPDGQSVLNAEFIAAARTALPALIGEVRRLQTEAPAWIDVNDRLPEYPEHDWVLVKVQMVPEGWYGVPEIAELRKDGKWHTRSYDTPYEETCSVKITHWMPIPDPAI